jgi:hypothetical protein
VGGLVVFAGNYFDASVISPGFQEHSPVKGKWQKRRLPLRFPTSQSQSVAKKESGLTPMFEDASV